MGFGMVRFSSVSLKTVSRIVLVVAVTGSVVGCGSDAMRVDEASLANPFSGSARFGRSGQPVQTSQSSLESFGWWKAQVRLGAAGLNLIRFFLIADIDSPRGGVIRIEPRNLLALKNSLNSQTETQTSSQGTK